MEIQTVATERETESHQDQLARLHAQVDALQRQLQRAQRLATVGTMTAMVAHEFNNILTPIINYAKLARSNPSLADKAITHAYDGGERAAHICKAILGLATEDGDRPAEILFSELISQTLAAMARDPQQDNIELVLSAPQNLTVLCRRGELQQVLLNLLLNARAAVLGRPGPRRIEISAERDRRSTILRIRDSGVGIPPENLDRVFQPFFTTKSSDGGESGGYGLGLAICRDIIEKMGGEISLESDLGKGTTFTLRLAG